MKNITRNISQYITLASLGMLPIVASAQLVNPLEQKSIGALIQVLVQDILVGIIAPIVVTLALIYSG